MRIAWVGPHFGEEPPISGERGSGTVFFTGCPLRCVFCQNHQISHEGLGEVVTVEALVERSVGLAKAEGVHNVNFVSPDPFFPQTVDVVAGLRQRGFELPVVYNLSGYQSVEVLGWVEEAADIYLPDYKYGDSRVAAQYASCPDYPGVALEAIEVMLKQKGVLDVFEGGGSPAGRGVLVRHLVLPGHVENSLNALTSLFVEFGAELPVSLMSQYRPRTDRLPGSLTRRLSKEEFDRVYAHAGELGFRHLFVQFPEGGSDDSFFPDFRDARPFKGGAGC